MSSGQFGRGKTLLAAVVGVAGAGVIVGAAGLLLYHALDEKKKLKDLRQHVARLDLSLSELHEELLALRNSIHSNNKSTSSSSRRSRKNSLCSSRSEYETADEMFSALNTDDEEFYDLDSEDETTFVASLSADDPFDSKSPDERESTEPKIFEEVDILMKGDDDDRLNALHLLREHECELSENPNFLWRYAKAHQMQAVYSGAKKDMEAKKKYIYEGLEYAKKALELDSTNPDVHKWFAILTGMQGDFVSIREKIQNAYVFQKHVQIAVEYKSDDYSLYHLLGRFKFEVANTSWIERKIASSIFGEIPDFTYSGAITDLLWAENFNPTPWKENRLLLAKCYIADGKYDEAIEWLDSAKKITPKNREDEACDEEVTVLMEKYKKYRK